MRRCLLIWLLCLPLLAYADHLFEAGVRLGVSGWSSQPIYVGKQAGLHVGGQLYYAYLSSHVVGVRTGLTFDRHNAGFAKSNYQDGYSTIDVEGERMDIDYTIGRLTERTTMWSVGVPLQLALARKNIYFLVGPKVVLPISNHWTETANHAALSVYYPAHDNRVYESYPLAASRDFQMTNSGSLQLEKVQWWIAAELNYILPLNHWADHYRSYLIIGAYFDYCFSKYTPTHSSAESLIMLTDTRDGFPLQRMLTPVMNGTRQGRELVSDCTLFDVGIKISYAISPYDAHRKTNSCHCLEDR